MKHPIAARNPIPSQPARPGATLVEVLMSLLIMSIGIGMVFGLFPLSIVSSIRATQLTNAVILQDNVRQLASSVPELFEPPLGAPWDAYTWKGQWKPNTLYNVNDVVMPIIQPGKFAPDPYILLVCRQQGRSALSTSNAPSWSSGTQFYTEDPDSSPDLIWENGNLISPPNQLRFPDYVVDPVGYYRTLVSPPYNNLFGNREQSGGTAAILSRVPRRAHVPKASQIVAEKIFSSPDSWTVLLQNIPTSVSGNTVVFPGDTNLDGITQANPLLTAVSTRVILTTPDGTQSLTRTPAPATSGNTLILTQPVPSTFNGKVRIESFARRYSFLFTVKSNGPDLPPAISSAVIFNRSSSAETEYIYDANFGTPNSDQVSLSWTPGTDPDPHLKNGNWIFDTQALQFYRIKSFTKPTSGSAMLTLDRIVNTPTSGVGSAMIMPGILTVDSINLNE